MHELRLKKIIIRYHSLSPIVLFSCWIMLITAIIITSLIFSMSLFLLSTDSIFQKATAQPFNTHMNLALAAVQQSGIQSPSPKGSPANPNTNTNNTTNNNNNFLTYDNPMSHSLMMQN